MWLLAELTYACPLQCPYCSNPLQPPASRKRELTTEEWIRVMREARKLGAVQLGFSGGEPLVRRDLGELIAAADEMGFYCNLITSAIGLNAEKIARLRQAGVKHIQISFQGSDRETNARFGGADSFDHKMAMTREVIRQDIPPGLNFVPHRHNIKRLSESRRDVQYGHDVTLDHFRTREEQEYALTILQFKLDILWSMLNAMQMACEFELPPFHSCKYEEKQCAPD